jgi:hypothetical protein
MAHYRTMLTSDNLMAADLWDDRTERYGEWIVKIISVAKGEVVGEKGRKKGMPFIRIANQQGREHPKPLGLNATNCETIRSLVGSPDVKRWPGLWITLYVTQTDSKDGKRDCIRIRPESPKVQETAKQTEQQPAGAS